MRQPINGITNNCNGIDQIDLQQPISWTTLIDFEIEGLKWRVRSISKTIDDKILFYKYKI